MNRRRREEGSALVMALIFVNVVSLLIAATLSFTEFGSRFTARFSRPDRAELYSADGAIEAAIRAVETGQSCSDVPAGVTLNGGQLPAVSCAPPTQPPGGSDPTTRPRRALLAVGDGAGEGVTQYSTSGELTLGGDLFSNSTVVANTAGGIIVDGAAAAVGGCTGTVDPACPPGPVTAVTPPAYLPSLTGVPDWKPVPGCSETEEDVISFVPGYYDDAVALTQLTKLGDSCDGRALSFAPGTYYFDFDFASAVPCSPAERCVWTIDDPEVSILAGTEEQPTSRADLPDGCAEDDPGSQFVFGGGSRIEVLDGFVDLCAPKSPGQRISLYAMRAGSTTSANRTLVPETPTTTSFNQPEEALNIDGLLSPSPLLEAAGTSNATIRLEAYGPAIPAGSKITSASMRVSHYQSMADKLDVTATVYPGSGAALPPTVLRDDCTAICSEVFPLTLNAAQLNGVEVDFTVALKPGEDQHFGSLDGIWLDVSYVPPALRPPPPGSCLLKRPYDPEEPTACALLEASGPAVLSVGGTLYAPDVALDLDLDEVNVPALGRGAIVRSAHLGAGSVDPPETPIIDLPELAPSSAITTLGDASTDGVVVSGDPLVVMGDVLSLSKVSVDHPPDGPGLVVRGSVYANGTCDEDEIETEGAACDPVAEEDVDPSYAPPDPTSSGAGAEPQPPSCSGWLVTLSPGWYKDAALLNQFTEESANDGCDDRVVWFKPGVYYFNFDFDGLRGCDAAPGTDCVWIIDDPGVKVVGGAPRGWSENDADGGSVRFPGACRTDGSGVNVVFGGPSRMEVLAGSLELCASTAHSDQPVVLHGLSGNAPSELSTPWRGTATSTAFTPADAAEEIGEGMPAAASSAGTASISLSAFAPPESIPAGSRIDDVKVVVRHREGTGVGSPAVSTSDGTISGPPLTPCATWCTQKVDLDGVTSIGDLQGVQLAYSVSGTGTAHLDGIELEVIYTPSGYERLSGCLLLATHAPNSCSLLEVTGFQTKLALQGVVYAPDAGIDVELEEVGTPVFGQGVMSRTIALDISPRQCPAPNADDSCYEGATVSSLGDDEAYVFTAFVDGRPKIRARVVFTGPCAATCDLDSEIKSWSVLQAS